jgi:hypothetical protein
MGSSIAAADGAIRSPFAARITDAVGSMMLNFVDLTSSLVAM